MFQHSSDIVASVEGRIGCLTLNRPKALNALSLQMVRDLTVALQAWAHDERVLAVVIRGMGKAADGQGFAPFGAFCAGGDIRYFHEAALAGDPSLEDFFTEEYALNHLIHTYPKPYIALMDGIVMGGGMGLCQGGALADPLGETVGAARVNASARAQGGHIRIVTERTKMAMPETNIGLFPDVGGGYFLSRCPGFTGEYLGLTGHIIGAQEAMRAQLADGYIPSDQLPALWSELTTTAFESSDAVTAKIATKMIAIFAQTPSPKQPMPTQADIDAVFGLPTVSAMFSALKTMGEQGNAWATQTLDTLQKRSPLMLHVVLEHIRRARSMGLADELRMERDMVRHCFFTRHLNRHGAASETVEGIRALVIDKDNAPRWNPPHIGEVTDAMVQGFFDAPWPAAAHPLAALS